MIDVSSPAPISSANETAAARAHVLFVDDEENILNSLRRLFHRLPEWECHFALGPKAAIRVLTEHNIAVIVSDHRMPEMSGAELLAIIRERRPNTVRMMLTGQANLHDVERVVNAGEVFRFILKPWRDAELIEAVRSAVRHFLLRQENEFLRRQTEQQNIELKNLNVSLESRVEERTEQLRDALHTAKSLNGRLEQSLRDSLMCLFSFVEQANPRMGAHCRRVADLARKMAAALGMADANRWEVETTALLHDVGKLGLPAYLSEKDLSLMRPEEEFVYRLHAHEGAERLRSIGSIAGICVAVAQHHERYNGSGFPDHLDRSQICDAAYVVGICDFYDNLVSQIYEDRVYHLQEARRTIEMTADKEFPQRIVSAMLSVLTDEERALIRRDAIKVSLQNLASNMRLARNLYTVSGTLLLAENGRLTRKAIARIRALTKVDRIAGDIFVYYGEDPAEGEM